MTIMNKTTAAFAVRVALSVALAALIAGSACAQPHRRGSPARESAKETAVRLERIDALLARQGAEIATQNQRISSDEQVIANQKEEIEGLKDQLGQMQSLAVATPPPLAVPAPPTSVEEAVAPRPPSPQAPQAPANQVAQLPTRPVGEAPAQERIKPQVLAAVPQAVGVLTPPGHFVFQPTIEYDRSSSNRLVFEGVEIVPGLQLGLINATTTANDTAIATDDIKFGVTRRLEVEALIPFVYQHDLVTTLAQQTNTTNAPATITTQLEGTNIGDVELVGRYQLNGAVEGQPIFIGNLLVKTTTGTGPFDVRFDANGIAHSLATGTGFWGIEPSLTMLIPSDPVVLYANLGFLYDVPENINKTIGTTHVGDVNPGSSVNINFGFGFALNPKFSFSLGYENYYVFNTSEVLGGVRTKSNDLEVGALTFGWA
ncbi:MAG: transporter, partial [Caulobacteraceae bacterium]